MTVLLRNSSSDSFKINQEHQEKAVKTKKGKKGSKKASKNNTSKFLEKNLSSAINVTSVQNETPMEMMLPTTFTQVSLLKMYPLLVLLIRRNFKAITSALFLFF